MANFYLGNMMKKSTVEDIRKRFDSDVERFSQLETGQQAVIDAPLMKNSCFAAFGAIK